MSRSSRRRMVIPTPPPAVVGRRIGWRGSGRPSIRGFGVSVETRAAVGAVRVFYPGASPVEGPGDAPGHRHSLVFATARGNTVPVSQHHPLETLYQARDAVQATVVGTRSQSQGQIADDLPVYTSAIVTTLDGLYDLLADLTARGRVDGQGGDLVDLQIVLHAAVILARYRQ